MAAVALTGYGSAADRKRAFDSGFDAHLAKPVDPARLIGVATKLTHRRRKLNAYSRRPRIDTLSTQPVNCPVCAFERFFFNQS